MFIGLTKGYIEMGGVSIPNLAGLLAAYQADSDVNVLSTPHILTTDNEEAEIIVGDEVPHAGAREVLPNSGTSNSVYSSTTRTWGLPCASLPISTRMIMSSWKSIRRSKRWLKLR